MMCGDGVNDIAAMKTADISFALLNGFENETKKSGNDPGNGSGPDPEHDIENERRTEKFYASPLGKKYRRGAPGSGSGAVVDPRTASVDRIKKKIDEALKSQLEEGSGGLESLVAIWKEERRRGSVLKKGGAGAARILANDDAHQKTNRHPSQANDGPTTTGSNNTNNNEGDGSTIKPGEASLAAAFSSLRPCVDGVETVLRTGTATAAFSLSLHRTIALGSLMSCYTLATLYRDGFRYGKYMWNVELALMMAMDQARYDVSCRPCPRIARIRPHRSVFHVSSALSIGLQAVVHLCTLTAGARTARILETARTSPRSGGLQIRWRGTGAPVPSDGASGAGLLGKSPFRPNHVTNTVFLLSVLQNCVLLIVNHVGYPFHRSILESRPLCLWSGASLLFCSAAAVEICPPLNRLLELAPVPSGEVGRAAKVSLLRLFAVDVVGSLAVDRLCLFLFDRELWDEKRRRWRRRLWRRRGPRTGTCSLVRDCCRSWWFCTRCNEGYGTVGFCERCNYGTVVLARGEGGELVGTDRSNNRIAIFGSG